MEIKQEFQQNPLGQFCLENLGPHVSLTHGAEIDLLKVTEDEKTWEDACETRRKTRGHHAETSRNQRSFGGNHPRRRPSNVINLVPYLNRGKQNSLLSY